DFRQRSPDSLPFDGIVVDEDNAVHANIEILRDLSDVLRFWRPVDLHRCEIAFPEHHVLMTLENLKGIGLVVLRNNSQDGTSLAQFPNTELKVPVACSLSIC